MLVFSTYYFNISTIIDFNPLQVASAVAFTCFFFVCLFVCLFGWLVVWLFGCLVGWFVY